MSEVAEKLAKIKDQAVSQLSECGVKNIDHKKLDALVDRLKTMVNNQDALLVSGTDESELETVRTNFVVKNLGIEDKAKGMNAINAVAKEMSGIRQKNRAAFYYMVQHKLN